MSKKSIHELNQEALIEELNNIKAIIESKDKHLSSVGSQSDFKKEILEKIENLFKSQSAGNEKLKEYDLLMRGIIKSLKETLLDRYDKSDEILKSTLKLTGSHSASHTMLNMIAHNQKKVLNTFTEYKKKREAPKIHPITKYLGMAFLLIYISSIIFTYMIYKNHNQKIEDTYEKARSETSAFYNTFLKENPKSQKEFDRWYNINVENGRIK